MGGLSSQNTLTELTGSFTGKKDVALKLKAGVLVGGVSYKFKLTVADVGGTTATNTYVLKTNGVPSTGNLSTSTSSRFYISFCENDDSCC